MLATYFEKAQKKVLVWESTDGTVFMENLGMGTWVLIYRTFSFSVHSKFLEKHRKKASRGRVPTQRFYCLLGLCFILLPHVRKTPVIICLYSVFLDVIQQKNLKYFGLLRSLLNDSTNFKLIYRYAFDFARWVLWILSRCFSLSPPPPFTAFWGLFHATARKLSKLPPGC